MSRQVIFSALTLLVSMLALLFAASEPDPAFAQEATEGGRQQIFLPLVSVSAPAGTPIEVPAGAQVIHVATTGSDAGSCGTTAAPCRTLQRAIDIAAGSSANHAFIKVAQGTYTGTGKAVATIVTGAPDQLTIVGGIRPPEWDFVTVDPENTVIDGQNARRGIFIRGGFDAITIRGIAVKNSLMAEGLEYDLSDPFIGGGLSCVHSSLVLSDMLFQNNVVRRSDGSQTIGGGGASVSLSSAPPLSRMWCLMATRR